ncbi:TetR family transcriptional regulator [Saccharopolyspora gloriosae]|uniref:TetR family transcriptional regulator n=1 Tax=Saccharopolyspora gloriosae TaxID=455344 RepID=UPI001FB5982F|nr:TetR family transcriptional regulator [Saccharopolyspora gloriosae]
MEVLAAVNRLPAEWGSDEKLTMRAVAKEVGVSAPSIYLHFAEMSVRARGALFDLGEQVGHDGVAIDSGGDGDDASEWHRACHGAQLWIDEFGGRAAELVEQALKDRPPH